MPRPLKALLLLLAWFLASGTQWELVQAYAWVRMTADNLETMSLKEAVLETFRPGNACCLCKAVAKAQHEQEAARALGDDGTRKPSLLPVLLHGWTLYPPRTLRSIEAALIVWRTQCRARPPTPPPRWV